MELGNIRWRIGTRQQSIHSGKAISVEMEKSKFLNLKMNLLRKKEGNFLVGWWRFSEQK